MRRAMAIAGPAVMVMLGAAVLWKLRDALLLLVVAVALAGSARAFVRALVRRGLGRATAIAVVYSAGVMAFVAFWMILGGPLLDELARAGDAVSRRYAAVVKSLASGGTAARTIAGALPNPHHLGAPASGVDAKMLAESALDLGGSALHIASAALIAFVLSACWMARRESFERLLLSLVPARYRRQVRSTAWDLEIGVGRVLLLEALRAAGTVIALSLLFRALHLQYATLGAVAAAVVGVMPVAGLVLGIVCAYVVGATVSELTAFGAASLAGLVLVGLHLACHAAGVRGERRHHPILVVLTMVALTPAFGLPGFLLAPAAAAAAGIIGERLLLRGARVSAPPRTVEGVIAHLPELRARAESLPEVPELRGLVERLEAVAKHAAKDRPEPLAQPTRQPAPDTA